MHGRRILAVLALVVASGGCRRSTDTREPGAASSASGLSAPSSLVPSTAMQVPSTPVPSTVTIEDERRVRLGGRIVLDLDARTPKSVLGADDDPPLYASVTLTASADLDHDGTKESVVALHMLGNACPGPDYTVITSRGDVLAPFASCTSGGFALEGPETGPRVLRVRGANTEERYTYANGTVLPHRKSKVAPLRAVKEQRGPGRLDVDLDGDGRPEHIDCQKLRFLLCTITGHDGRQLAVLNVDDRLGVLATKTNGYFDLVSGADNVARWDGKTYQ